MPSVRCVRGPSSRLHLVRRCDGWLHRPSGSIWINLQCPCNSSHPGICVVISVGVYFLQTPFEPNADADGWREDLCLSHCQRCAIAIRKCFLHNVMTMRLKFSRLRSVLSLSGLLFTCWAGYASSHVVAWPTINPSQSVFPDVTNVPPDLTNAVYLVAASYFSLALRSDGTVSAWGEPSSEMDLPAGLTNVIAISAGTFTCMALRSNGTIVVWGSGSQTNVPQDLTNVVAVAAGQWHCLR